MTIDGFAKLLTPVNLRFLLLGLQTTLELAVVVSLLSFVIALPLGTHRATTRGARRWPSTLFVDLIRNTPLLVILFLVRFGAPSVGIRFDSFTAAIVAMTIYNSANLAEIVRAGIESVPRGQLDAANASGFSGWQTYVLIMLPQALRTMLPSLVSQFIILLQGTSLASAVSVMELTSAGEVLFNRLGNPLETFTVIGLMYFVVDYALGALRNALEGRVRSGMALAFD